MQVIQRKIRSRMVCWWIWFQLCKEWRAGYISNFNIYKLSHHFLRLITELGEGEMMMFTLTLNDDLTATLSRYKDLMKGKKPEPFLAGGKLPWVVDPD